MLFPCDAEQILCVASPVVACFHSFDQVSDPIHREAHVIKDPGGQEDARDRRVELRHSESLKLELVPDGSLVVCKYMPDVVNGAAAVDQVIDLLAQEAVGKEVRIEPVVP